VPVHIEELTSDVTVVAGELPLTPAQIDKLVAIVMARIADREQAARRSRDATRIGRSSPGPFEPED
jgi:hypothetical protein